MRPDTALAATVTAFLAVKLAGLLVNVVRFPVLRRAADGADAADVSLLIPMRDERLRLPATLPGLLGAGADEVVFLDDGSTDGSAEFVADAAGPAARVVTSRPRPDGWTGKTWACQQLAGHARQDLLAFCDADVQLAPGALTTAVAEMRRQGAELFSVFPRQLTGTLAERTLVPLIDDVLLCFLPFPLLRAPVPAAATANGSLLLMTRDTFGRLGGFAAVRNEVGVEDVALARLARRRGLRLGLALGGPLVATRMYRGYRELIVGLGRALAGATGLPRWTTAAALAWHVAAYTVPVLACRRHPLWAVAAAAGPLERLLLEGKTGRRQWLEALTVPVAPLAAVPVVVRSLARRQEWRGRVYR